MKNLIRLTCVFWLLLSVPFAESLDETLKKPETGNAVEQHMLGVINQFPSVGPKNNAEAVKWYRKAADQGHTVSQYNLGVMYRKGEGVPKDLVQAHVWMNIAGAAGDEDAKRNLEILEEQMTLDQKAEAMKLARELFAKLPKKK
jgi:TPR repeat protein